MARQQNNNYLSLIILMAINYYAIAVCAILSMVIGSIWYGPLFGKKWAQIIGATAQDAEARKKMQKAAGPLYGIQFVLSIFQVWVLAYYIVGWKDASGLTNALWIWAAFVLPTVAGSSMWNNDSNAIKWSRFLIQTGYQLILFAVYGIILGMWR